MSQVQREPHVNPVAAMTEPQTADEREAAATQAAHPQTPSTAADLSNAEENPLQRVNNLADAEPSPTQPRRRCGLVRAILRLREWPGPPGPPVEPGFRCDEDGFECPSISWLDRELEFPTISWLDRELEFPSISWLDKELEFPSIAWLDRSVECTAIKECAKNLAAMALPNKQCHCSSYGCGCAAAVKEFVKNAVAIVHPAKKARRRASAPAVMLHQNPTDSWGATRSITEAELVALTLRLTDPNNTTGGAGISLVKKAHGSFNQIYIMQLPSGAKRAIRVPGRGQVGVWNDSDAAGLSNQVLVMKYIRNTTTLPVPGVFAYDTTHNNEIGYPFMMMEGIAGKNVSDVWGWRQELTPELEGKRLRILKSLAVTMTSLRHIDFPALGRLDFDGEDFENPSVVAVGPGNRSSRQYFEDRYDELVRTMRYAHGGSRERHVKLEMVRMLMEALPCSATNTPANAPPETFVLRAPDFNWQNIMVDDTGDVVAIIDWDGVETVPRFLGWAKPPMFLCADFDPSWSWQGGPGNAPSKLEFYRKEYARFMAEAMGGQGDCVYAGKSHLYDHVLGALEEPTLTSDIIDRLLVAAIPRVSWEKISARVVERGWAPGEKEFIQERLQLLMRPVAGADHNFSF